jgi:hypothetical protein
MSLVQSRVVRAGALLAINLLFLMDWGFAGIGRLVDGMTTVLTNSLCIFAVPLSRLAWLRQP